MTESGPCPDTGCGRDEGRRLGG